MIPWFQFTEFYIGPIPIQVWGTLVAIGIGTSLFFLYKRAPALGLNRDVLLDQAFWMILAGLLGARLFYVLFFNPLFFLAHPIEIFKVWHGGLLSYGGFVGAIVGFFWYAKRKKLDKKWWLKHGDAVAQVSVVGWIIARIGCFLIHDHLGKPCDCFLAIDTPDGPRLEMALFEILTLLPILVLFYIWRNKKKPDGWFLGVLAAYYGTARFLLDFGRTTEFVGGDVRYLGLTPAQYFSMVAFVVGVYLIRRGRIEV